MPVERRPANPIPKGKRPGSRARAHRVSDNETLESVARMYGLSTTDLILHNFATTDPAEINWYLHEYVGCKAPTQDGRNWRFSSTANPGLIYIPLQVINMPPEQITGDPWAGSTPPLDAADVVNFLKFDPTVAKINFQFLRYKVYPSAYQKDVAAAFDAGAIKINRKGAMGPGAAASYVFNYDSLEVEPAFSMSSWRDRAILLHECTHAHLDIQAIGSIPSGENEAVAYLAEAFFLEMAGHPPLSPDPIRTESHRIARDMLARKTYRVTPADAISLITLVTTHPHYAGKADFQSNGFRRGLIDNLLR